MLFKSKSTAPSTAPIIGPARRSLTAHLARMSEIDSARRALQERSASFAALIEEESRVAQERAQLEQSIDARAVGAVVRGDSAPNMTEDRARLAQLTARHTELMDRAEIAKKVRIELQAQGEALLQQYRPLQPALNRLLHDAIVEHMEALAPALAEAERAYRKVLRQTFLFASAADQLNETHRLGVRVDALQYTMSVPEWPRVAAFEGLGPDRFAVNEDFGRMQEEAQVLIGRLLKGEVDAASSQAAN